MDASRALQLWERLRESLGKREVSREIQLTRIKIRIWCDLHRTAVYVALVNILILLNMQRVCQIRHFVKQVLFDSKIRVNVTFFGIKFHKLCRWNVHVGYQRVKRTEGFYIVLDNWYRTRNKKWSSYYYLSNNYYCLIITWVIIFTFIYNLQ